MDLELGQVAIYAAFLLLTYSENKVGLLPGIYVTQTPPKKATCQNETHALVTELCKEPSRTHGALNFLSFLNFFWVPAQ